MTTNNEQSGKLQKLPSNVPNPSQPSKGFKDDKTYQQTIENLTEYNEREMLWNAVDIPEDPKKCSKKLKFLIRRGVPDSKRHKIWSLVTGITSTSNRERETSSSLTYQQRLQVVFGQRIPKTILKPPNFGGSLQFVDHFLSQVGQEYCKRILCVIAMDFPELNYCPILPDLVCLLMHFLNEDETYAVVKRMIDEESKTTTIHKWFPIDKKGWSLFVMTLRDLFVKLLPSLAKHTQSLGIDISSITERWFFRLFVSSLPFQTVLRVFDVYLNEGKKTLYRTALALFKTHSSILFKCQSSEEFVHELTTATKKLTNTNTLMKTICAINISRKHIKKFNSINKPKTLQVIEPSFVYYRPKITQPSNIIKDEMFEVLYEWIPSRYRICDPVLLYSSEIHGWSFTTFLNKIKDWEPLLLLIKSDSDKVFGAYLSTKLQRQRHYFGTRECFLFTLHPQLQHFPWTEGNLEHFIFLEKTSLKIGGGTKIGLCLNETWEGFSERCETFQNEPLNGETTTHFECVNVEVYGFQ